ncbi:cyclophilin family peptidyl-prolyl cis-trans isomerase [Paenibacillus castaneae]|uniref:peptidylprolyl isomerase n=1 Tax=Paenibacillus castaneae TaxID=474957 RepID=UPI000C9CEB3B|nr:peptidylprolyl isomerase [Paenibacillus castaneae]NIK76555.1 cyclophilin family peptidyl-prolyl cis-trans isomerase [Paenibacillus castaneae]
MADRKSARFLLCILLVAAVSLIAGCGGKHDAGLLTGSSVEASPKTMSWTKMPEMQIDLDKSYSAKFHTTKGDFTVKLFADEAPVTVNNFVFLVRAGFYDGLSFHRIIESFMIQTGDPFGTGKGTPGYSIPDELSSDIKYEDGIVAMANFSQPNTGGSQFFICTGPDAANLNREPNYTIFGKVEKGMDVVKEISRTPIVKDLPAEKIIIESITIEQS